VTEVKEPTIYPAVETIREIQQLGLLCGLLPADGKLREFLEMALAADGGLLASRIAPVSDLHPHAVKAWIESFCPSQNRDEKAWIKWQSKSENMSAAIQELRDVEQRMGFKLTAEKLS